ncbi:retrovirus-related pol polyprotein from transposon TNT 1-94 [Tanacetum coccineum]
MPPSTSPRTTSPHRDLPTTTTVISNSRTPPPPSRLPHHLHLHLVTINTIVTTSSLPSPSCTTTRVRVVLLNPKQAKNKRIYVMSMCVVRCGGLWFGTPVKGRNTMWHDMICPVVISIGVLSLAQQLEKDLEIVKNKKEKDKSLALKARQSLIDKDSSPRIEKDEEYAMSHKDFKKFFRRRVNLSDNPDDKKNFRKVKGDKNGRPKVTSVGDPNHFLLIDLKIPSLPIKCLCSSEVGATMRYSKKEEIGIDFDETYAPVARLESIRILLAYTCAHDFKLFQMDVKSAFLNGFINEEVYVAQPPEFIDFEKPNHVFKLKKALYGLKQAPKAWYDRLKAFLLDHKYIIGLVDNTLFTEKRNSHIIIVQIYVDDIIFGSICQELCDDFSKIMHNEFEIRMICELNFFLGLQIKQFDDGIFFNQSKYVKEMLKKFGLEDSKPIKTPMSSETKLTRDEDGEPIDDTKYRGMIGSLLYLTASRPDIMFSVCLCTRFQEAQKTSHIKAVKRIFRYLTGCRLTSWFSKKQTTLAISTTKAKYVSARKACQQALWMKQALVDYDVKLNNEPVLCDNKGAIDLSKNPVLHSRSKHIEIRHHFLRDNVQKGNISIEKVASEDNIADILTKLLKREPFNLLRLGIGIMEPNA